MTLSQQLNNELNKEFDPTSYILKKHIYGSKKRELEIKKQNRAKKIIASL